MKRRLTSVLGELEWEAAPPTAKERRACCRYCQQPIRIIGGPINFEKHKGPCGLPCLAGGVEVGRQFHDDDCKKCRRIKRMDEDPTTYFIKTRKSR
jgi:hypothetical protein